MMIEYKRPNHPIHLPKMHQIPDMHHMPMWAFEFTHVSQTDVSMSIHNLSVYLKEPENLLQMLERAVKFSEKISAGKNPFPHKPHQALYYHIYSGQWQPMAMSPWKHDDRGNADYLFVHAVDPNNDYETVCARQYVAMDVHKQALEEKVVDLDSLIQKHVAAGFDKTVARVIEDKAKTLEQIERDRKSLNQQKEQIERQLAALNKAEEKELERQRAKAERSGTLDRSGYVYLIREAAHGTYKIGRAKNPADRLGTFNVKLPFPVEFICTIPTHDRITLEKKLHAKFSSQRVDGEWFNLTDRDLRFLSRLARLAAAERG